MEPNKIILDNGINLIYHQINTCNCVNITLFFKVGQLYENCKNKGITHLVEHMFFRRLDDLSQKELYYEMESIGATIRGSTSRDYVVFYMTFSSCFIEKAINIFSKLLYDFSWKIAELENEKKVVKNQIYFNNNSYDQMIDDIYFGNSKFSLPIMGSIDNINNISIRMVNYWKKKYFTCNNSCVLIAGDVNNSQINNIINKFEKINNCGNLSESIVIIPNNFCNRTNFDNKIFCTQTEISDIYFTFDVNLNDEEFYYAKLISSILGEGVGSVLSFKLREEEFLTDEIFSSIEVRGCIARIKIETSVKNQDIKVALEFIFQELINFKKNINDKQFLSSIHFFIENQDFLLDSPRELNFEYGWHNFISNDNGWSIEKETILYRSVTIDKLNYYSNKILTSKRMSIITNNNSKIIKKQDLVSLISNFREKFV